MSAPPVTNSNNKTLSELKLTAWFLHLLASCMDFLYSWFLWKNVNRYEVHLAANLITQAPFSYRSQSEVDGSLNCPSSAV